MTFNGSLSLSMLGEILAEDILKHFSQNIGFDISCKLSPREKICMKCYSLFPGKMIKISVCYLQNLPIELLWLWNPGEMPLWMGNTGMVFLHKDMLWYLRQCC